VFGVEKTVVASSAGKDVEILKPQEIQLVRNGELVADFLNHDFTIAKSSRRTDNAENFFH
jgi:hypothetical protein